MLESGKCCGEELSREGVRVSRGLRLYTGWPAEATETRTAGERPGEGETAGSLVDIWRKHVPGRRDSKSKGPEEGTHIGFLWHEAAMWEKQVSEVGR